MRKILTTLLLLLLLLSPPVLAGTQQDCLDTLAAQSEQVSDAELYPSVYIAQGVLETGWCKSGAVQYNNYWGIKCRSGNCFAKETWEIYQGEYWRGKLLFEAFDSIQDATQAYIDKINTNLLYGDVDRSDRDAFISTLARHWATDPDYPLKLKSIIDTCGLGQYDPLR